MPWLIPPGTACNDNFNIAAQHRQKTEQAINGKTGQLATYQVGNLGLINTQPIGRVYALLNDCAGSFSYSTNA